MEDPRTAAVDLVTELVGIDSVNPGLVPGAAGESRIVEHLRGRLAGRGFAVTVVPAAGHDDRPSLVAVTPGPPDWPTVVLNGHLDTVGGARRAARDPGLAAYAPSRQGDARVAFA